MTKKPHPDDVLRVARYLSAAYVASVHGVGVDYYRKKYADHPVGNFWLEVAEMVIEVMEMSADKRHAALLPPERIQ